MTTAPTLTEPELEAFALLRSLQYGSLTIHVQAGKITRFERNQSLKPGDTQPPVAT